jgi:hypothetical protein
VSVGGVGPKVIRASGAEEALLLGGHEGLKKAREAVAREVPLKDDLRSTGEYRREMASLLLDRAVRHLAPRPAFGGPRGSGRSRTASSPARGGTRPPEPSGAIGLRPASSPKERWPRAAPGRAPAGWRRSRAAPSGWRGRRW